MRRLLLIVFALAVGACGGAVVGDPVTTRPPGDTTTAPMPDTTTTTEANGPTVPVAEMEVVAYFLADSAEFRQGPFLVPAVRTVPQTSAVARASLEALVAGPTADEESSGLSSSVPDGTLILGLDITDGLATVDLSREFESGGGSFSMSSRLAQVVFTLTRFETVDRVAFQLDGDPVTVFSGEGLLLEDPVSRVDYLDLVPLIMVDDPAWGSVLSSPVRITGVAAAFEGVFGLEILDASGEVIASPEFVMNTDEGLGFPWGGFDVTIPFDIDQLQPGTLRVFSYSAEDDEVDVVREYEVTLAP